MLVESAKPGTQATLIDQKDESSLTLEAVWQLLAKGGWNSKVALREASGFDDDTLDRIISFLNRWNLVEVQWTPELLLRRKPGTISPTVTADLLRYVIQGPDNLTANHILARRVACRTCGGRELIPIADNEVECNLCGEKQWCVIEADESFIRMLARVPTRRTSA